MWVHVCMTLLDLSPWQEVSSEYHYSPLDEATISYTKLLEKVVFSFHKLLMNYALLLIYACVCEFRINKRTFMAMWRSISNQLQGRMNSMPK